MNRVFECIDSSEIYFMLSLCIVALFAACTLLSIVCLSLTRENKELHSSLNKQQAKYRLTKF